MSLRLMPDLDVVRPADANETAHAWARILRTTDRPAALVLSRQNLTIFDRSEGSGFAPASLTSKGAYTLIDASDGDPQVILVGTGSEVEIAVAAREKLEAEGVRTRVVSMPCVEWFVEQDEEYQDSVLPVDPVVVTVEAGSTIGWRDLIGADGSVGIDHFGASAAGTVLYEKFGLTADAVVAEVKELLED
jgi:transketolase